MIYTLGLGLGQGLKNKSKMRVMVWFSVGIKVIFVLGLVCTLQTGL